MEKAVVGQYTLAIVATIALAAINIWGVQNEAVNTALVGVITASAWGGFQRNTATSKAK